MTAQTLKICSYNCGGLKRELPHVNQLCTSHDIILLQETWMYRQDLPQLNSVHKDFLGAGVTCVDLSDGPVLGRPYGGLAVLWRRSLASAVRVLNVNCTRIMAVAVDTRDSPILIINVYMPCDAPDNIHEFGDVLGMVNALIHEHPGGYCCMIGDMNADFNRRFGAELSDFCRENNLVISDRCRLPRNSFSFVSGAHGSTSWLDHVVATEVCDNHITNISILTNTVPYGHMPISINLNACAHHVPQSAIGEANSRACAWNKADNDQKLNYRDATNNEFVSICIPHSLIVCRDVHCTNSEHIDSINRCYIDSLSALRRASDLTISNISRRRKKNVVPGWNDFVREHRAAALEAYHIWLQHGKPRYGLLWDVKRRTEARFKWAMRQCKKNEVQIRADNMAKAYMSSDRDLWTEVQRQSTSKLPRATSIGNAHNDPDIACAFRDQYNATYNCVADKDTVVSSVNSFFNEMDSLGHVNITPERVKNAFKKLSKGKAPGPDGLNPEHLLYAGVRVHVVFSILFMCMLSHGTLPADLISSTIMPIVKNKSASLKDISNYRPIALASSISKALELCLYDYILLRTNLTDNQFGFRNNVGTETCIYVLKETVHLYISSDSPVFCAFLDASKAFDRVSHYKLFQKLCDNNVPVCITRLLCAWYRNQSITVSWGQAISSPFYVRNGVRQGSILSPLLFNLYVDGLSKKLNNVPVGCVLRNVRLNHLFYADDICLIAPSIQGLRQLLEVCEIYSNDFDIIFNATKSHCLYFLPTSNNIIRYGDVRLCGEIVKCVPSVTYLGHVIASSMSDESDMCRQKRFLYCRANQLSRNFFNCSRPVKRRLFMAYCYSLYCNSLWYVFRVEINRHVKVAYNTCFRKLFGYRRSHSASEFFVENRVNNFTALCRNSAYSLFHRVMVSKNLVVGECYRATSNSVLRNRWRVLLHSDM